MIRSSILALVVLVACSKETPSDHDDPADTDADTDTDTDSDTDTDADTDSDADTDTDTDADTDAPTGDTGSGMPYGRPVSLTATCAPTANELRFTCEVTVDPPQPVQITYSRADGLGPTRVHRSDAVAAVHEIPIWFLAPNQAYDLVASATTWPTEGPFTGSLTTGQPPNHVGSWLTMTGASTMGLIGLDAPCTNAAIAVVYDTSTGDLVWYDELDPNGELGMLYMTRFTEEHTVLGITNGRVVEVDLMGNELVNFTTSYGGCCNLNHDVHKRDGVIVGQYQNERGRGLILDAVVFLDEAGNQLYEWQPWMHLNIPADAGGDFLHDNSDYLDADGNLLLSWLNRDTLAKIDMDPKSPTFGDPIWLMNGRGRPEELGNDITIDWSRIGGADSFGGQHSFHQRHDGRLMFLDNDHGRALVMTVDDVNRTATVDAQYATHEASCGAQGTAMDTRSGNAVVGCLSEWIREYDLASGNRIWEAEVHCRNDGGQGWSRGQGVRWSPLDGWE